MSDKPCPTEVCREVQRLLSADEGVDDVRITADGTTLQVWVNAKGREYNGYLHYGPISRTVFRGDINDQAKRAIIRASLQTAPLGESLVAVAVASLGPDCGEGHPLGPDEIGPAISKLSACRKILISIERNVYIHKTRAPTWMNGEMLNGMVAVLNCMDAEINRLTLEKQRHEQADPGSAK